MQVQKIQNSNQTSFGVKIGDNFIKIAHNQYNYHIQVNKKQNIYKFNSHVQEFEKAGFDDYELNYEQVMSKKGRRMHHLFAKNDSNPQNKINIIWDNTLERVVNRFMQMDTNTLLKILRQQNG